MSDLVKMLGKEVGPKKRIVFALCALFAPGVLLISIVKAFLRIIEDMDSDELARIVKEIKDV